eukprot:751998-Hanusia_phi.AAC.4
MASMARFSALDPASMSVSVVRKVIVMMILLGTSAARDSEDSAGQERVRIMLGSCNKVERKQPFWELIIGRKPDAWVWMGDNVYADQRRSSQNSFAQFLKVLGGKEPIGYESIMFEPSDLARLKKMYEAQKTHAGYRELREKVPIYGTWDDHDYGINDGDYRYPLREESKQAFLDFLDVPKSDPRRQRNGVYAAHDVQVGDRVVKIVLLDNRYNKSPYCSWPLRFLCQGDEDFLGEEQWRWLERTLVESRSDANIVVSGIQILTEHRWHGENWARFPQSRQRLLDILLSSGAKNVILFSGDVHFAEVSRAVCRNRRRNAEARELLEMTSSGREGRGGGRGKGLTCCQG